MGDFFFGWRRKSGIVLLVCALMFMVGWVRSSFKFDSMLMRGSQSLNQISSIDGSLWYLRTITQPDGIPLIGWNSAEISKVDGFRYDDKGLRVRFVPSDYVDVKWRWEWEGFHFGAGESKYTRGEETEFGVIPYWSVVLPLTLLSAYLLLSKPQIAKAHSVGMK